MKSRIFNILSVSFASMAALVAVPAVALAEEEPALGANIIIPEPAEFIPALVAFLVIWFILAKFAWPSINGMLEKRQQTIKGDLEDAEAAKIEAQQTLDDYREQLAQARREAGEILAEAKRSGEQVKADITAQAQDEADIIVAKARVAIENEKRQAITELQDSVAELSVAVAGRLIKEDLSDDDHRKLVEKYIEEVGSLDAN